MILIKLNQAKTMMGQIFPKEVVITITIPIKPWMTHETFVLIDKKQ